MTPPAAAEQNQGRRWEGGNKKQIQHRQPPPSRIEIAKNYLLRDKAICSVAKMAPTVSKLRRRRLKNAIRRDILFLLAGAVAYFIVSYIETNASDHEMRFASSLSDGNNVTVCIENQQQDSCGFPTPVPQKQIIDAGFILTKSIHSYLARNRDINDILALANSLLLTIPIGYVVFVTLWKGDFRLSFRLIATLLFRSLCGWFT